MRCIFVQRIDADPADTHRVVGHRPVQDKSVPVVFHQPYGQPEPQEAQMILQHVVDLIVRQPLGGGKMFKLQSSTRTGNM